MNQTKQIKKTGLAILFCNFVVILITVLFYTNNFSEYSIFNFIKNGQEFTISKFDLLTNPILLTFLSSLTGLGIAFLEFILSLNVTHNKTGDDSINIYFIDEGFGSTIMFALIFAPIYMILLRPANFVAGENYKIYYFLIIFIQCISFYVTRKAILKVFDSTIDSMKNDINRYLN